MYTSQPGKQGFSGVCVDTKAGHSSRVCKVGSQVSGDQANLQGFSTLLLAACSVTTPGGGATPRKLHAQTSSQHSAPSSS